MKYYKSTYKYTSKRIGDVYELSTIADMIVAADENNGEIYFRTNKGELWNLRVIKELEETKTPNLSVEP